MEKQAYQIVVWGSDWDVYRYAFRDWIDDPQIAYEAGYWVDGWLRNLNRLHVHPGLNRIVSLPGKSLWNKRKTRQYKGDGYCFILLENRLRLESGIQLIPYLRKHYPGSKIVCFLQDLVQRSPDEYSKHKAIDIEQIKRDSDLVISYDEEDAKRYGLRYYHTVYSSIKVEASEDIPACDVYFLGKDKGRLELLASIAKRLRAQGLKADFYVVGCEKSRQIADENIHYIEGMSYSENLQHAAKSRCLLELVQAGAMSATFRAWESIALGKKLYTNNTSLDTLDSRLRTNMRYFSDAADIDANFIKSDSSHENDEQARLLIQPEGLLQCIEQELGCTLKRGQANTK